MFADAHLHMTDSEFGDGYGDISDAKILFSCTSEAKEWKSLRKLCKENYKVIPFYGVHPWFSDGFVDIEELESILKVDSGANIGEIGLDYGKSFLKYQITLFMEQLNLAEKYDRIVSIHMVRCENEMLHILKRYSVRKILHSFVGPESYIQSFSKCGCYFSISPVIFRKPPMKVKSILNSIPRDRLLIETDDPNNRRRCLTMSQHVGEVGSVLSIAPEELMGLTLENSMKLIC